jgi:hypothetical protein
MAENRKGETMAGIDARFVAGLGALVLALSGATGQSSAQVPHNGEFVQKNGTRLTVGDEAFRYGGPNVEWLGIEA